MEKRTLYTALPNLTIGFHGCDIETYEKVLKSEEELKPSVNDYDWLGNGIYFWEQNLGRAWEWARKAARRSQGNIKNPAVIGAVIDLGFCLNLLEADCIKLLKNQYEIFKTTVELSGEKIPVNKNIGTNTDFLIRRLDCGVIQSLHQQRSKTGERAFDSVRGMFLEGAPIYETSGFKEHSHIQICVRNPNCIKGYFAPRDVNKKWIVP